MNRARRRASRFSSLEIRRLTCTVFAVCAVLSMAAPVAAHDAPAHTKPPRRFAPVDVPGPRLDIAPARLRASLFCYPRSPKHRGRTILLVPGTGTIPSVDYHWNYERAFTTGRRPWCEVTFPASADGDIQRSGEYVVAAIRAVAATSGNRIDMLGWSQGGMVPRWALRFWPDTRALVANVIGLAPSNHGTVAVAHACAVTCLPSLRQQGIRSQFLTALNSYAETFAGIAYTNIYTHDDDIVQPNLDSTGSSSLHTGRGTIANVALQDVCPANTARHFAIGTYDPVAYALVVDALSHSGRGADAKRIAPAVCRRRFQPGVNAATFKADFAALKAFVAAHKHDASFSPTEPPLAPYVFRDQEKSRAGG